MPADAADATKIDTKPSQSAISSAASGTPNAMGAIRVALQTDVGRLLLEQRGELQHHVQRRHVHGGDLGSQHHEDHAVQAKRQAPSAAGCRRASRRRPP